MTEKSATPVKNRVGAFLPVVLDVVVPMVLYYVLRSVGLSTIAAFTVAGVVTAAAALVVSLRNRKLDTVKILVAVELLISLGIAIAVDDPRVAAIRPAIYLIVAGAYFLFSCVVGVPILYVMATPMATNGGDPRRTRAYRWAWDNSGPFRRYQRQMTGTIGALMLADSVFRVVVVFSYPAADVDRSFLLSNAAGIALIVGVVVTMAALIPRGRRILDDVEERLEPADRDGVVPGVQETAAPRVHR